MMVIAGPGSGKTAVLTNRVARLCEEGIKPENILVITFTKSAAAEMERRCRQLSDENGIESNGVMFGTFHSVFFYLLKKYGHFPKLTFADLNVKKKYMSEALAIFGKESEEAEHVITMINEAERYKVSEEKVQDSYSDIFEYYFELIKSNGFLDFEDMLIHFVRMLKDEPRLCSYLQDKYKYILLDEFQDINAVQYEAIRLLSSTRHNVFAVGDEDQSIYGFRGSNPMIMKRFIEDFEDTTVIKLEDNFRSASAIVEAGNKYIAKNKNRFEKIMRSAAGKLPNKDDVISKEFNSFEDEQLYIYQQIERLLIQGVAPSDIVILYRNNKDVKNMERYLNSHGMHLSVKKKETEKEETEFFEEVIAFLKISLQVSLQASKSEDEDLMEEEKSRFCRNLLLINSVSSLNLPRNIFTYKAMSVKEIENLLERTYSKQAAARFRNFIDKEVVLEKLSARAGMKYIQNVLGYSKELEQKNLKKCMFEEIFKQTSTNDSIEDLINKVSTMKNDFSLNYTKNGSSTNIKNTNCQNVNSNNVNCKQGKCQNVNSNNVNCKQGNCKHVNSNNTQKEDINNHRKEEINIMTIHQAKGLEYNIVFLASLMEFGNDNAYSFNGNEQQDVEEERRIIYVGMTRAKNKLFMTYVK
ncbi:MAG: ATP-dependent helicase [Lachnospiraceae bacterium]|nr:ATP-dependent helicase [Lachnospiraceae bacterium]